MHPVTRVKIGFTMAFTTPKINATISRVTTLRPVVGAVRVMPLNSHVATASAPMLARTRRRNLMSRSCPFPPTCQNRVDP